jgi:ADP-ribosylglycohydrolase
MERLERYRGCLLGLAAGDALGTTLEFKSPGSFEPIEDMVGGGPFDLRPGEWTDDTSMALCLAESLLECEGFDPPDQLERYHRWYRFGHLSSNGRCFDIGNTVREAIRKYEFTGEPFPGSTGEHSAGNGSIVRLAPVPMAYARDPARAIEMAGESSRTTHGATAAVDACRYLAGLIVGALRGDSRELLLSTMYSPVEGLWKSKPLDSRIAEIAAGSFKVKAPPAIEGAGYVVRSLEAALWAFHSTETYRAGCLAAANLGNDADTTAAVYGALAGAFYGEKAIPHAWRARLARKDLLEALSEGLLVLSKTI